MPPVTVADLDSLLHQPVWAIRNGAVLAGLLVNINVYPGKAGGRHVQINTAGNTHPRGPIVPLAELHAGPPPELADEAASTSVLAAPRRPRRTATKPKQATAPNLARLAEIVSTVVEQVNSSVVGSQLVEELEADGRPEVLREVLDCANVFRMLAVDYTHVVAQAVAGADADIAVALTDLVGDLGKAGTGFSEVWVNLANMQRELAEHAEWPPRASSRKPAPTADEQSLRPDWLARQPIAQLHIDTLRKTVAGCGGAVKIPPGVVADLVELARTHPDSPAEGLAATCEAWCTDDGGALVPAAELTQVLDNLQTEAGDGGR